MDAYEFIKDGIIQGKFNPGTRLMEESLAKELGLSRTPIREAIKQLESEGLVIPLKRGVSVREFSQEDIRQIYDLRSLLEGYGASQAAMHRERKDLKKLYYTHDLYEKAINQYLEGNISSIKNLVDINNIFHEDIINASKNSHIYFHISKVVVLPMVYRSYYWYDQSQIKQSLQIHHTIIEAIENKEPERAKAAMNEHIYQGRDHVLNHLDTTNLKLLIKEDAL